LMDAKLDALKKKLSEQEALLAEADLALSREKAIDAQTFTSAAFLALSIFNSAPPQDYRLLSTRVYLDGKLVSEGGKHNQGLPRNNEQIFFAPVQPGCHEVMVRAEYVRLKNDVIERFRGINRVEKLMRRQTFIAKDGFRVQMEIEGFEAQSSFIKWYKAPELRFNRSMRPNFLTNAPLLSMDQVLKQGRVRIDYLTENQDNRLIEKSLSIDGLPILTKEKHDPNQGNIVFDAPLAEGKHTLSVTLVFGEKPNILGGPIYNFRLNFERVFLVMSGQTTIVNLVGMPENGFRSTPEQSRYARVTSKLLNEENSELFPNESCEEIRKLEKNKLEKTPTSLEPVKEQKKPEEKSSENPPKQLGE